MHGWDLAHATGQASDVAPECVAGAQGFVDLIVAEAPDGVPGLFGKAGDVPRDASAVERLIVLTGRDAEWQPPTIS